jgi:ATP-dependent Clp protease, protease subunit
MTSRFLFALAGSGSETLELDVYSTIGEGSFWSDSLSAAQVRSQLRANPRATTIQLRINSDGGDPFDAQAIYADLQDHPARVEVTITGIAASAATLIAIAGDEIRMAEGAWFMIHDAFGGTMGSPEDLRRWADVIDQVTEQMAKAYAARTRLPMTEVRQLMAAETWMTAAEARAKGFVDKVIPMAAAPATASRARAERATTRAVAFAAASGGYRHAPQALSAARWSDLTFAERAELMQREPKRAAALRLAHAEEIQRLQADFRASRSLADRALILQRLQALQGIPGEGPEAA